MMYRHLSIHNFIIFQEKLCEYSADPSRAETPVLPRAAPALRRRKKAPLPRGSPTPKLYAAYAPQHELTAQTHDTVHRLVKISCNLHISALGLRSAVRSPLTSCWTSVSCV